MAMLEFPLLKGHPGGENPLWDPRQNGPPKIRTNIPTRADVGPCPIVYEYPHGFRGLQLLPAITTFDGDARILAS